VSTRPRVPGTRRARCVLAILPAIDDELDDAAKDGLAVRNAASLRGKCPACGARAEVVADQDIPGLWHAYFLHEAACPVTTDEVAA